jgi:hypothetical protein
MKHLQLDPNGNPILTIYLKPLLQDKNKLLDMVSQIKKIDI